MYPDYTVRYRLTIEVETPQGLKTGSSVIASYYGWVFSGFGLASGTSSRVTGEAVFVDLGDGRNFIVTLTNRSAGRSGDPWKSGPMNALHMLRIVYKIPYDKRQAGAAIRAAQQAGPRDIAPGATCQRRRPLATSVIPRLSGGLTRAIV